MTPPHRPARRRLLAVAPLVAAPAVLRLRTAEASMRRPDVLSFVHTHTGERLEVGFRVGDTHVPQAMRTIDRFLRDFRTGDVHPIDPALIDQLHRIAEMTGSRAPFQVISGYRAERTNAMLRQRGSGGVARTSLHLQGRAIDVRLADVRLADLRDAARELRAGGVGYYPGSDFVHLDTGRVRAW